MRRPSHVGKIWAADYDVDVAGELLDGRRVAGECKWWTKPAGANVYADLARDAARNGYYAGTVPVFFIFAKSFTPELKENRSEGLHLLTPTDLFNQ